MLATAVSRAGSAEALQSSLEKSILLLTLLTQWDELPCHHILLFSHFSNHNSLLISHDVNAPMERNNPMLLLQHERCYLSLLMAKYLCQRKFTDDHLVLTINTVTMIYSMERPGSSSSSTMGSLPLSEALIRAFSPEALHLCCHVKTGKDQM